MEAPTLARAPHATGPSPGLLTPAQAAATFGVSPKTFDRMARRDAIPYHVVGKRRRFAPGDLDAYRESLRVVPAVPSWNLPDPPPPPPRVRPPAPSPLAAALSRPGRKRQTSFAEKFAHLRATGGVPR